MGKDRYQNLILAGIAAGVTIASNVLNVNEISARETPEVRIIYEIQQCGSQTTQCNHRVSIKG